MALELGLPGVKIPYLHLNCGWGPPGKPYFQNKYQPLIRMPGKGETLHLHCGKVRSGWPVPWI